MLTQLIGVAGGRRTLRPSELLGPEALEPRALSRTKYLKYLKYLTDSPKDGEVSSLKPQAANYFRALSNSAPARAQSILEANESNLTPSLRQAFVSFSLIFSFPP